MKKMMSLVLMALFAVSFVFAQSTCTNADPPCGGFVAPRGISNLFYDESDGCEWEDTPGTRDSCIPFGPPVNVWTFLGPEEFECLECSPDGLNCGSINNKSNGQDVCYSEDWSCNCHDYLSFEFAEDDEIPEVNLMYVGLLLIVVLAVGAVVLKKK